MFIKRKTFILLITYLSAAVIALGALAYSLSRSSEGYTRSTKYGYEHAFSELVTASKLLDDALHRGAYATGRAVSNEVCADVYGACLAAEMTVAALPFTTTELQETAGFIGVAGDYAQSLLRLDSEGFDDETRDSFASLYEVSSSLTKALLSIEDDINEGRVSFDEPENRYSGGEGQKLSASMLKLEKSMGEAPELSYDGRYSRLASEESADPVSEAEAKKAAAEFLGVSESELKTEYRSEAGASCFSFDDKTIIVSPEGLVSSLSTDRAVTGNMSNEELAKRAEKFLKAQGFEELYLNSTERVGDVLYLEYNCSYDGVCLEAEKLRIGIAADDGEIYFFSLKGSSAKRGTVEEAIDESAARQAIPAQLRAQCKGLVYAETPGGSERLCYDFACESRTDSFRILVDALTGKQFRIVF